MTEQEFTELYNGALTRARDSAGEPLLEPWFQGALYPPVIGFGLPRKDEEVPLLTLALNPSALEISEGHIPKLFDPATQWKAQQNYFSNPYRSWFSRASAIVSAYSNNELSYGGVFGPGKKVTHLDLSPHPTQGMFDSVYDSSEVSHRRRARELLEQDFQSTLLPTLRIFHQMHSTRQIILFGYCPPDRGSRSLKEFWKNGAAFEVAHSGECDKLRWAHGTWRLPEGEIFKVYFMSQGPSAYSTSLEKLKNCAKALSQFR